MSHLESRKLGVSEKYIDPSRFKDTLEDAENLLKYAAEIGIEIEAHARDAVLEARSTFNTGWNEHAAADLLSALARLAARLKPVTAESLKASRNGDARATGRRYWVIAIVLAVLIIPYSLASYVTSSISDAIRKDIVTANDLAVKLTTQTATPVLPVGLPRSDVVVALQTFASTIRAIDIRASQLNWFVFHKVKDPFGDLRPGAAKDTKHVRTFEQEMSNRTFKPSHADFHRFLVAGIAGAVVGFFSNFAINTGTSVSPLAVAFLAGYAVDVFFSFLEGFMQAFMKDKKVPGGPSPASADGISLDRASRYRSLDASINISARLLPLKHLSDLSLFSG